MNNKKAKTKVKCLDKVAQYYKISRSTVQRIEKNIKNGKPLFKVKKSGRPRLITKLMEKKFDETWESLCGPLQTVSGVYEKLLANQEAKVEGFDVVPSKTTIWRYFYHNPELRKRTLSKRPRLTPEHMEKRLAFVKMRIEAGNVDKSFDNDEAQLQINPKNWSFIIHVGDDLKKKEKEIEKKRPNTSKRAYNQAEVKIFLSAVITRPEVVNEEEFRNGADPIIDSKKNGKVALFWLREERERKRGSGPPIMDNITLNGDRYVQLHWDDGGIRDSVEHYLLNKGYCFDENLRSARKFLYDGDFSSYNIDNSPSQSRLFPLERGIRIQQDNAGGHGPKSDGFKKLIEKYENAGIAIDLQSPCSPELNMCDLGFWWMLKAAITRRCSEIPDKGTKSEKEIQEVLWKIAQEEWDNLNPINLLIIAEQKKRMFEKVVELNGGSILMEPHTGIRKKIKVE